MKANAKANSFLDETDRKLLQMLQENAKITIREMAEATGKSHTAIRARLAKLEKEYITRYTAIIDCSKMGYRDMVIAFLRINSEHPIRELKSYVEKMREVRNAYIITGEYQLFITAKCLGHDHAMALIESLRNLPGVEEVKTQLVLDRIKEDTTVIIPGEDEFFRNCP